MEARQPDKSLIANIFYFLKWGQENHQECSANEALWLCFRDAVTKNFFFLKSELHKTDWTTHLDGNVFFFFSISRNIPATAAAKSLQSCLTLCDPIDGSPPGSPVPGSLQARTLERVAISFSNAWKWKVKVKSLSRVWLLVTPWTAAYQATPSMGFSMQEYWSGVPLPNIPDGPLIYWPWEWQASVPFQCSRLQVTQCSQGEQAFWPSCHQVKRFY